MVIFQINFEEISTKGDFFDPPPIKNHLFGWKRWVLGKKT
jgi:hypothetical protein